VGSRPLFSANKDSFIHDLITLAGGVNIAKDSKVGMYSRERVIRDNPDCIIVVGMGIQSGKEKKIWRRYKTLKAVRNDKIHAVDSYGICSPTPETFTESLDKMVEILHPELKKDE
jgi:iron complex transport system substrate-binding protein